MTAYNRALDHLRLPIMDTVTIPRTLRGIDTRIACEPCSA
ncbi:hypothetical protein THIARS_70603 [Thiomonas delicata]|uniref:Uncharacterized protein n=1 Tax=Thiomonas delicata TaxID=364030 RepID=A0A238D6P6_THIDL|nr:hypothetical protein THIARS_70603 [Thiomonas delicata]